MVEHQENMRPANSDEDIIDDSTSICACSGEALVKTTQSIETSSSALGEGPEEGMHWCLTVRLKELIVSISLEKEELMSLRGPWISRGLAGVFNAFVSGFGSSVWVLSVELSSDNETPTRTSLEPSSGPPVSEPYPKNRSFLEDFRWLYHIY